MIVALSACKKETNSESATDAEREEKEITLLDKPVVSYETTAEILNDYELVWKDEFDGDELDLEKWNYRAEGDTRNYAEVSRNTIHLDGEGHLVIEVTKDEEGNYFVGQTGTEGIFETTYGYFETRAKMNKGIGPHVAFWLQSPTMPRSDNNPGENGSEVDIFEYHRENPGIVHHNIHWNGYGEEHKQIGIEIENPEVDEGFHTFGLLWREEGYTFYVDGKKTWETTEALSHRDEYMILSTELTGFGGDPKLGEYPDQVVFDYVRVYKPKK